MRFQAHAAGLCFLLLMAGCASKPAEPPPAPTPADLMRQRAGETAAIAEEWEKANAQVQQGKQQVKQGEQQLQAAREQREAADRLEAEALVRIEEGRRKIAQGQARKQQSEQSFARMQPETEDAR